MKKLISVFTAICACISACVMLTACTQEHTHSYKDEWSSDASHHWHACSGAECDSVSEKSEHVWDGGIIISDPTAEAEGEKKFTCLICSATKSESVPFESLATPITEEEWDAAVTKKGNFVYLTDVYFEEDDELAFMGTQEVIFYNDIIRLDEEEFYTKVDDKYYLYSLNVYSDDDGETYYDVWEKSERDAFLFEIMSTPFGALEGQFSKFTFNATDGFYYADDLTISGTTSDIKIKFENGAVVECTSDETFYGMRVISKYTIEYKDVEITLPSLEKMPHTCSSDYWQELNQTHHIRACFGCNRPIEGTQALHVWDEGEETELGLIYTCTECHATKSDSVELENAWNNALMVDNFDNITFGMHGVFLQDGNPFDFSFKLDGDRGADAEGVVTDAATVANIRNTYINTVLCFLENFDAFEYDPEDGVFTSAGPISYELTINVGEIYSATITVTDVIVFIDGNNNLASMTCVMKQEIVEEGTGEESELNLSVTFEFSDYGTTVI